MAGLDMQHIGEVFNSSLVDEDDVDLKNYLSAYEELYKLCSLLGTIFGFVGSEIMSKMDTLRVLKNKDTQGHFHSMKSMISFEKDQNLLHKSGYVSGSRTLLRLHRGLAFISLFLSKVNHLGMHDGTSQAGRDAYDQTLAKYHSWFIRNGAIVAMYALPTKEVLLNRVCANKIDQCVKALPGMLEAMETVYKRVQHHYAHYNLLDLP